MGWIRKGGLVVGWVLLMMYLAVRICCDMLMTITFDFMLFWGLRYYSRVLFIP